MKPEVKICLNFIESGPQGKKVAGPKRAHLHRYWEWVYDVQVGLTNKCKLDLPMIKGKEQSPIYDGSAESNWPILEEPYGKLVDLAISRLKALMVR